MQRYWIQVEIVSGGDEFWDAIERDKKSGVDEVVQEVRACLSEHGFVEPDCVVSIMKFEALS